MKDVADVLRFLGYRQIRTDAGGDWRPIGAARGRFGTTDRTDILTRKHAATARLVDRETGELVATARKSCPIGAAGGRG